MIVNNPNLPAEELKMPPIPPKDAPVERVSLGICAQRKMKLTELFQQPVEAPPPYSPASGSNNRQPAPVARQTSTPASVFRPQQAQTVNHFELFTKHDALSGTLSTGLISLDARSNPTLCRHLPRRSHAPFAPACEVQATWQEAGQRLGQEQEQTTR